MTVREVISEIEALSLGDQQLVLLHFKDKTLPESTSDSSVRYLDRDTARPLIKEILSEHAGLFRKLAQ